MIRCTHGFQNDLEEIEDEIRNLSQGRARIRHMMRPGAKKDEELRIVDKELQRWIFLKEQLLSDQTASNDDGKANI